MMVDPAGIYDLILPVLTCPLALLLALPSYVVLRRAGKLQFWHLVLAGAALAVIEFLVLFCGIGINAPPGANFITLLGVFSAGGVIIAATFWWIAIRMPAPSIRSLFAIAGAFIVFSAVWVAWGILTPGDYFANGSRWALWELRISPLAGANIGYLGSKYRMGRYVLLALMVAVIVFFISAPNGWWLKGLPSPPPVWRHR